MLFIMARLPLVCSAIASCTALAAIVVGELFFAKIFAGFALFYALAGIAGCCITKPATAFEMSRAAATVLASWAMLFFMAVWPLYFAALLAPAEFATQSLAAFGQFENALFETVSGLTSTGLTMATNEQALPGTIIFFRSIMQWVGGVGFLAILMFFAKNPQSNRNLYFSSAKSYVFKDDLNLTFHRIVQIYLFISCVAFVLLLASGATVWQAVNFTLAGVSTGGFSLYADSIAGLPRGVQMACAAVLVMGAISFPVYWKIRQRQFLKAYHLPETVLLVVFITAGTWVLYSFGFSRLQSVFMAATVSGTAGFSVVDISALPVSLLWLFCALMFIGGPSDSTTGGIKLGRLWVIIKSLATQTKHADLRPVIVFIGCWLGFAVSGAALLAVLIDCPVEIAAFETLSAVGNVGLSTGITTPDMPFAAKSVLIIFMAFGRIEIIPVLYFVNLFNDIRLKKMVSMP